MKNKLASKKRLASLAEKTSNVYSGRDGRCCCGCSGIHRRSTKFAKENSYDVYNDAFVKKVVRIIQANSEQAFEGGNHVYVVIGDRLYVAYTCE
jgi:hypothetical protein